MKLRSQCSSIFQNSFESYHCLCEIGYVEIDGSCADFKECEIVKPCHTVTEKCIDSTGGYRCICAEGFHRVGSECVDVNECDLPKPGLTGQGHVVRRYKSERLSILT